jgi:hypothetical protein
MLGWGGGREEVSIYRSHILNPGSLCYSHIIMNPEFNVLYGVQNIAAIFLIHAGSKCYETLVF